MFADRTASEAINVICETPMANVEDGLTVINALGGTVSMMNWPPLAMALPTNLTRLSPHLFSARVCPDQH